MYGNTEANRRVESPPQRSWQEQLHAEEVRELKARIEELESRPLNRHGFGYAVQFGFGGRMVLTEEECAEAVRWTTDDGEMNEAGELVICSVPVKPAEYPLIQGAKDLGASFRENELPHSH